MKIIVHWTPEEDALAIQHLAENRTFKEVGELLGRPRNAVLSRARRKHWSYPAKKDAMFIPEFCALPAPVEDFLSPFEEQYKEPVPEFAGPPKRFVKLESAREGQCRFIHGDAREQIICGAKAVQGCSWCADHARVVFSSVVKSFSKVQGV